MLGLFTMALFQFNSCQKEFLFSLPQEFKDYTYFNTGSYWVYQDSVNTALLDSTFMARQELSIGGKAESNAKYQYFEETRVSSYYDSLFGTGAAQPTDGNLIYGIGPLPVGSGLNDFFYMPYNIGDSTDLSRNCYFMASYNWFKAGKIYYSNVKVFKTRTKQNKYSAKLIYWAKYVGIIKRVTFDGNIWELQRYHIQK